MAAAVAAFDQPWAGASADKIRRKTRQIDAWRREVAASEPGITCACSGSLSGAGGRSSTSSSSSRRTAVTAPLPGAASSASASCAICRRPASSAATSQASSLSSSSDGRGEHDHHPERRGPLHRGVRRFLRKLSWHDRPRAEPPAGLPTKMYVAGEDLGEGTGGQPEAGEEEEDEDPASDEEDGRGLKGREARLRRAQRLLARNNGAAAAAGLVGAGGPGK
ncbi:hypothetical protein NKR23_g491 [Pleurostoma richardsiae]|uniref:Uncharacterized protein n=1 Tax=Pleurostoma richardsiae TaxID=41990 RepID=A0AA38S753_9PEZI|nr:hypothetical protein NKR23_g491 [Pleurostoma richardsiae]